MRCILVAITLVLCSQSSGAEPDAKTISPKQIWAWRMHGTRDIRKLDPEKAPPLVEKFLDHVEEHWGEGRGMVVRGDGLAALQHLVALTKQESTFDTLSADESASLVFYTKETSFLPVIVDVNHEERKFIIRYRVVPHIERYLTRHLALIPIGRLAPGKYRVQIEQLPLEKEWQEQPFVQSAKEKAKLVCRSFEFVVASKE